MWVLLLILVLFFGGFVLIALASESNGGFDDLPFD